MQQIIFHICIYDKDTEYILVPKKEASVTISPRECVVDGSWTTTTNTLNTLNIDNNIDDVTTTGYNGEHYFITYGTGDTGTTTHG